MANVSYIHYVQGRKYYFGIEEALREKVNIHSECMCFSYKKGVGCN